MKRPPYWIPLLYSIAALVAYLNDLHWIVLFLTASSTLMLAMSISVIDRMTRRGQGSPNKHCHMCLGTGSMSVTGRTDTSSCWACEGGKELDK